MRSLLKKWRPRKFVANRPLRRKFIRNAVARQRYFYNKHVPFGYQSHKSDKIRATKGLLGKGRDYY